MKIFYSRQFEANEYPEMKEISKEDSLKLLEACRNSELNLDMWAVKLLIERVNRAWPSVKVQHLTQ